MDNSIIVGDIEEIWSEIDLRPLAGKSILITGATSENRIAKIVRLGFIYYNGEHYSLKVISLIPFGKFFKGGLVI